MEFFNCEINQMVISIIYLVVLFLSIAVTWSLLNLPETRINSNFKTTKHNLLDKEEE